MTVSGVRLSIAYSVFCVLLSAFSFASEGLSSDSRELALSRSERCPTTQRSVGLFDKYYLQQLLTTQMPAASVASSILSNGLSFVASAADIADLKKLGASRQVIAALLYESARHLRRRIVLGDAKTEEFSPLEGELRDLVNEDVSNVLSWTALAYVLANERSDRDSEYDIKQALELKPNDPLAHYVYGVVLSSKDLNRAEQEYRDALALRPCVPAWHSGLSGLLRKKGDSSGAELELRKAIELDPEFSPFHESLASLLNSSDIGAAIAELKKASLLDSASPHLHFALGTALLKGNRAMEAVTEFRKALQLDASSGLIPALNPKNPAIIHDKLAEALFAAGSPAEAVKEYQAAVAADPSNSAFQTHLENARAQSATQGTLASNGTSNQLITSRTPSEPAQTFQGFSGWASDYKVYPDLRLGTLCVLEGPKKARWELQAQSTKTWIIDVKIGSSKIAISPFQTVTLQTGYKTDCRKRSDYKLDARKHGDREHYKLQYANGTVIAKYNTGEGGWGDLVMAGLAGAAVGMSGGALPPTPPSNTSTPDSSEGDTASSMPASLPQQSPSGNTNATTAGVAERGGSPQTSSTGSAPLHNECIKIQTLDGVGPTATPVKEVAAKNICSRPIVGALVEVTGDGSCRFINFSDNPIRPGDALRPYWPPGNMRWAVAYADDYSRAPAAFAFDHIANGCKGGTAR